MDGLGAYLRSGPDWDIRLAPGCLDRGYGYWVQKVMPRWKPHGMIAAIRTQSLLDAVIQSGIPTVNVSGTFEIGMPQVTHDNAAIGRLAAGHFIERGIRHMGCIHMTHSLFSQRRCEGFRDAVAEASLHGQTFIPQPGEENWDDCLDNDPALKRWLRKMPKPAGIFANYDYQGQEIVRTCQQMGLRVPDDVAVVGSGDDERLCLMRTPALSSVDLQAWKIGFEAARMLDSILSKGATPAGPLLIPPLKVVCRQSSDIVATSNRDIAAAIRFIRDNACRADFTVADVLRQVHVSRRYLERQFVKAVGRSPHDEIDHVRLARAKELLADTDLKILKVAHETGFSRHENLCVFFRRKTGLTPTQYRGQVRMAAASSGA